MFHAWDATDQNHQPVQMTTDGIMLCLDREKYIYTYTIIKGRPSQSSSYQLKDLKTSNLDEWLVGCNDEDNSCHEPVEGLDNVTVNKSLRRR